MSDTTAMIDVTATMLPSTVMSDRSLDDQMASSAMRADSKNLFMAWLLLRFVLHSDEVAVCHAANRIVRPCNHLVAHLQPGEDFKVLVARDAHLDRTEFSLAGSD